MTIAKKAFLTGATGFVGRRLLERLVREGLEVTCAVRRSPSTGEFSPAVGNLEGDTDWSAYLSEEHVVIHTAARAHIMKDEVTDPLTEYRKVNVEGTLNLARRAAEGGVRRFIFISS